MRTYNFKKIQSPSAGTLSFLLVPIFVILMVCIFIRAIPSWAEASIAVFIAIYAGTLSFFCIRQKCYKQLVVSLVRILILVLLFFGTQLFYPS